MPAASNQRRVAGHHRQLNGRERSGSAFNRLGFRVEHACRSDR